MHEFAFKRENDGIETYIDFFLQKSQGKQKHEWTTKRETAVNSSALKKSSEFDMCRSIMFQPTQVLVLVFVG